ncbi:pro-resilin-like [Galleria mellonella]|uniref:Pro-resilin-like n=1 Tax=Galleria mellonella TaxID=7137 RepID=A0A6J1WZL8_GALME|nr:pro-resilin-like [Galleria mellonella]
MKTIICVVFLVAITVAEPPPSPSLSYLPPSTGNHGGPYQGTGPQLVSARTLEGHSHNPHAHHGAQANGFARSSPHGHGQGRFAGNSDQGYDRNAAPFGRNGLDDANPEPANYNFGYMVNDYQEGTDFGHHEERQDERAMGEYHVVLPDGRKQTVSYEADERGFKPQISYEDSESDAHGRSNGYDSNANNVRSNGGGHHGNGRGY